MQVLFLSGKDPLDEGMATYSSILAWEIPWTEEPGVLQSMGSQSPARMSRTCLICLSFIKSSTLCKGLSPLSSLIKVHKMLGWKMAPQTEAYCRRVLEQSASRVLILMLRMTHQISAMQPPWNYCRELSKSNSSLDWWEEFRIINWETTSSINCQLASLQEPFLGRVWKQR